MHILFICIVYAGGSFDRPTLTKVHIRGCRTRYLQELSYRNKPLGLSPDNKYFPSGYFSGSIRTAGRNSEVTFCKLAVV